MLATFAGFFLYIGAAELLPEAHRSDHSRLVISGDPGRGGGHRGARRAASGVSV